MVLLVAGMVVSWILTTKIERDRRRLAADYAKAQIEVMELKQERRSISDELQQARADLDGQATELSSLQHELGLLQTRLADAEHEIGRLHVEQTYMAQGQMTLAEQLDSVNREKDVLEARLSSLKELRSAIKVVKLRLRDERRQTWLARIETKHIEDQRKLASGNHGFVIHNGTSTLVSTPKPGNKLQVRVLDPQTE